MEQDEAVHFRFNHALPGLEVLDAPNSSRIWRWFGTAFGIAVPASWQGDIVYRGRRAAVGPGKVFCNSPGELFTTPKVDRPGDFYALVFAPSMFRQYATEHGFSGEPDWRVTTCEASPELQQRLGQVFRAFNCSAEPMALQTSLVDLFEVMMPQLISADTKRTLNAARGKAERMREVLHSRQSWKLDLDGLAREVGLDRFQALRAFKQRYGIPPHAYQICYRIGIARDMLLAGEEPTAVASSCGFADQSHFGRHFRRLTGTTPSSFAKMSPLHGSHIAKHASETR